MYPIQKVDEGDESQFEDDGGHPDQVSTSASEASNDSSKNSQPPLLDFIGTACTASTWFTSCFPCAVVDINHCDDNVVNKLNRANAMSVMYGIQEEPYTVEIPGNSFELKPGEKEYPKVEESHQQVHQDGVDDADDDEVEKLAAELEEDSAASHPPSPEVEEVPQSVHHDTPMPSPSRKKFNIRPRRPKSVRKLFKRKQQQ
jgi:hypothetical protein